jgi:hypothetical protein
VCGFGALFITALFFVLLAPAVDPAKRDEYLARLMAPPNNIWGQILAQAQANPAVLQQQEVIKSLQNVLQTNVSVCSSLGHPYLSQMVQMADSMLQVRAARGEGDGTGLAGVVSCRMNSDWQWHAAADRVVVCLHSVCNVSIGCAVSCNSWWNVWQLRAALWRMT